MTDDSANSESKKPVPRDSGSAQQAAKPSDAKKEESFAVEDIEELSELGVLQLSDRWLIAGTSGTDGSGHGGSDGTVSGK